jgi:endonuclease YncB( thermonuclease family)
MNNIDKRYQELLQDILDNGIEKKEKFGRWLGTIFLPEEKISVNEMLIKEGLANPY